MPEDALHRPVNTFSAGMRQRLSLARALCHNPRLLLFDEPSGALDPAGIDWLATNLKAQAQAGQTVVLVTHDLTLAASVSDGWPSSAGDALFSTARGQTMRGETEKLNQHYRAALTPKPGRDATEGAP